MATSKCSIPQECLELAIPPADRLFAAAISFLRRRGKQMKLPADLACEDSDGEDCKPEPILQMHMSSDEEDCKADPNLQMYMNCTASHLFPNGYCLHQPTSNSFEMTHTEGMCTLTSSVKLTYFRYQGLIMTYVLQTTLHICKDTMKTLSRHTVLCPLGSVDKVHRIERTMNGPRVSMRTTVNLAEGVYVTDDMPGWERFFQEADDQQ